MSEVVTTREGQESSQDERGEEGLLKDPDFRKIYELGERLATINRIQHERSLIEEEMLERDGIAEELRGYRDNKKIRDKWADLNRKAVRSEDEDELMRGLNIALEKSEG